MRIRHYLQTHKTLQDVLTIVIEEIQKRLIVCSPDTPNPQIGAVSFIQHFGNTLNHHPHFHVLTADGIFTETAQFHESSLTPDDIADTYRTFPQRNHLCTNLRNLRPRKSRPSTSTPSYKRACSKSKYCRINSCMSFFEWHTKGEFDGDQLSH
jgi:hypothetical protein